MGRLSIDEVVAFFDGVIHGLGSSDLLPAALCLVGLIDLLRFLLQGRSFPALIVGLHRRLPGRALLLSR